MLRASRVLAVFSISLLLVGCGGSLQGAPDRLFSKTDELHQIRINYGNERILEYRNAPFARKSQIRNEIVLGRLYAIDIAYGSFENKLTRERQKIPFAATTASIALSGTGALIADKTTKSILAAVDTGLKGTKEAYDKDILIQKTIDNLQKSMRSNRIKIKSRILENLEKPVSQYPLELALSDVEDYYNAGTITSGFIGISEQASVDLAVSESLKVETITTRFTQSNDCNRVRNFIRSGINGTVIPKNRDIVSDFIKILPPPQNSLSIAALLRRPNLCRSFLVSHSIP